MDIYSWLKAMHVVSVVVWISGTVTVALVVAALSRSGVAGSATDGSPFLSAVKLWDRRVTTPAMILVWSFGLALASLGHWFPAPWLLLKIAVVLLISGLHGMLSGTLTRLSRGREILSNRLLLHAPAVLLVVTSLIVMLAVLKPH